MLLLHLAAEQENFTPFLRHAYLSQIETCESNAIPKIILAICTLERTHSLFSHPSSVGLLMMMKRCWWAKEKNSAEDLALSFVRATAELAC